MKTKIIIYVVVGIIVTGLGVSTKLLYDNWQHEKTERKRAETTLINSKQEINSLMINQIVTIMPIQ